MDNEQLFKKIQQFQYTISLTNSIKKKLDSHLQNLKHLQHFKSTRQSWLINAIQTKLRKEDQSQIPRTKHLNIKITQDILEKIDKQLEQTQTTYSRKKMDY